MLPKAEERKTDLRNTSIMEVIILVVIVMLIVVTDSSVELATQDTLFEQLQEKNKKLENEKKELIRENQKLDIKIKELEKEISILKDFVNQSAQKDDPGVSIEELLGKLNELTKENVQLQDQINVLKEKISKLEELKQQLANLEQENRNLKEINASLNDANELLRAEKKELENEVIALNDKIKRLEAEIAVLLEKVDNDKSLIEEIIKYKAEIALLKDTVAQLKDNTSKLQKELESLKIKNNKQKDLIDELQKQIGKSTKGPGKDGGGGRDNPSCLMDKNRKIKYLGEVRMIEKGYSFNLLGTDKEKALYLSIPGVKQLTSKTSLSKKEFGQSAIKVREFGESLTEPCVYYVKIYNSNMLSKESGYIEQFFYKLYVN